jgi:hypothetical protein
MFEREEAIFYNRRIVKFIYIKEEQSNNQRNIQKLTEKEEKHNFAERVVTITFNKAQNYRGLSAPSFSNVKRYDFGGDNNKWSNFNREEIGKCNSDNFNNTNILKNVIYDYVFIMFRPEFEPREKIKKYNNKLLKFVYRKEEENNKQENSQKLNTEIDKHKYSGKILKIVYNRNNFNGEEIELFYNNNNSQRWAQFVENKIEEFLEQNLKNKNLNKGIYDYVFIFSHPDIGEREEAIFYKGRIVKFIYIKEEQSNNQVNIQKLIGKKEEHKFATRVITITFDKAQNYQGLNDPSSTSNVKRYDFGGDSEKWDRFKSEEIEKCSNNEFENTIALKSVIEKNDYSYLDNIKYDYVFIFSHSDFKGEAKESEANYNVGTNEHKLVKFVFLKQTNRALNDGRGIETKEREFFLAEQVFTFLHHIVRYRFKEKLFKNVLRVDFGGDIKEKTELRNDIFNLWEKTKNNENFVFEDYKVLKSYIDNLERDKKLGFYFSLYFLLSQIRNLEKDDIKEKLKKIKEKYKEKIENFNLIECKELIENVENGNGLNRILNLIFRQLVDLKKPIDDCLKKLKEEIEKIR